MNARVVLPERSLFKCGLWAPLQSQGSAISKNPHFHNLAISLIRCSDLINTVATMVGKPDISMPTGTELTVLQGGELQH